jgi:hypothetical protein
MTWINRLARKRERRYDSRAGSRDLAPNIDGTTALAAARRPSDALTPSRAAGRQPRWTDHGALARGHLQELELR